MPKFKKAYTVYPEQRGESYRSGFYHPISILILAIITLTVALAIFANSGFFANKNIPSPTQTPQVSPKSSPTKSPDPIANPDSIGANWKTYTNSKHKITFQYPLELIIKETDELNSVNKSGYFSLAFSKGNNYLYSFFIKNLSQDRKVKPNSEKIFNGIKWEIVPEDFCSHGTCDAYKLEYLHKQNDLAYFFSFFVQDKTSQVQIEQILSTFQFLN